MHFHFNIKESAITMTFLFHSAVIYIEYLHVPGTIMGHLKTLGEKEVTKSLCSRSILPVLWPARNL